MSLIGSNILHFETVTSTNDIAWQYAGNDKMNGLVVVADEQQEGRGTRGRRWHAERGTALLCSVLIKLQQQFCRPVMLTIWTGISVCKVIEQWSKWKPLLKWPNDVLVNQQKICGILVEVRNNWSVIGIGINVHKPICSYNELGIINTAYLNDHSRGQVSVREISDALRKELNAGYDMLMQEKHQHVLNDWATYSGMIGLTVEAETTQGKVTGRLESMHWNGVIVSDRGNQITLAPESILKLNKLSSI